MGRFSARRAFLLSGCLLASGCGTYVPGIQEFSGNAIDGQLLVQAIAESVRCDIQNSVRYVIDEDKQLGVRNADWFDKWGVQYTLTLSVEEKSAANPSILWKPPGPLVSVFTLGAGASLSASATRTLKMNFFYLVEEFYKAPPCRNETKAKYRSQSLLIQDDLKLKDWLVAYVLVVGTGAGNAPVGPDTPVKKEALTDRIKFQVVTGGSVAPAWQLTRLDVNRSGSLLSASRDRTHELLITYGPVDPDTRRLKGPASEAFVTAQIGAAVSREEF